ncbi:hypothetical protein A1OK_02810 [Enterovibrio norvegicus FF-454]|uniref:Uncharacterized protein n=2 Tax=Enterovibrio norvegicus TaxID=188144 RepID=A0A1E5C123_9GAMM|nr:hypothetical protein A1OK_02810 [Enterovibrio norvegicus FF-454]
MKKAHILTATGIAVLVSVIGFVSMPTQKPLSKIGLVSVENHAKNQTSMLDLKTDTPAKNMLSDDAEYPTPVIQLQQTLTYGLINAEAPSLPILQGDLETFAQSNVGSSQNVPEELSQLKARLQKLKNISNTQ